MVKDQVKIAPNGKVYALDVGSICLFLKTTGYNPDEIENIIKRLKIIFKEFYK